MRGRSEGNEIVLRGTEEAVERAEAVFDGLVGLAEEGITRPRRPPSDSTRWPTKAADERCWGM